jgi:flagellar assembly protein FliH
MKSLYKVIKADYLNMYPPRVIEFPKQKINSVDTDVEVENTAEKELISQQLLNDSRRKAEEIISQARLQADQLLKEAHEKVESLQRDAEKAGYEKGYQTGKAVWEDAQEQLHREIAIQKESLVEERKKLLKKLEPEIIQLAVSIARSVIHAELYLSPNQINSIARAVLDKARGDGLHVLKVSPQDYDEITSLIEDESTESTRLEVKCDNSLMGCCAETPYGEVEGSIDDQLEEVICELREVSCSD